MRVNDIFSGIQGEGRFAGEPVLFVRVSGCNLKCSWCDTAHDYHVNLTIKEIIQQIDKSKLDTVVWTGGEPILYKEEIVEIIEVTSNKKHHLETNGTIRHKELYEFDYVSISPKSVDVAKTVSNYFRRSGIEYDIKVVTDLHSVGVHMIKYATILMPLTRRNRFGMVDLSIAPKVWDYCVENNIRYGPRLHVDMGKK